jgi:hypothetical protein
VKPPLETVDGETQAGDIGVAVTVEDAEPVPTALMVETLNV